MNTILMYHGFTDKHSHGTIENYHGKHLYIKKFEDQIVYLKKNYKIISLPQLVDAYREGRPLDPGSIVITMDDGYSSNYRLAFPVLTKHQVPASIFLTTDFIDQKSFLWVDRLEYAIAQTSQSSLRINLNGKELRFDLNSIQTKIKAIEEIKRVLKTLPALKQEHMIHRLEEVTQKSLSILTAGDFYSPLSWEQVCTMQVSKLITIGSHTCSHVVLTRASVENIQHELSQSKARIETMTDSACHYFSYPNGQKRDFNDITKNALIAQAYRCALTTVIGSNNLRSDLYALKRLNIHNSGDLSGFKRTLSGFGRFLRAIKNASFFTPSMGQY